MAFFHQLSLLLWKNYTLKKRKPFIFIIELTVPLILFLILVAIRGHRPPDKLSEGTWLPHALPSAGIIPLLQSFCKNNDRAGKNGYQEFPNASGSSQEVTPNVATISFNIYKVMGDFAKLTETPVFGAAVEMRRLERDFQQLQDDPAFIQDTREIPDVKIKSLMKTNSTLMDFLTSNLSMTADMANDFMNATLNGSKMSTMLLERNDRLYELYKNMILTDKPKKLSPNAAKLLQQSSLLQVIFDRSSVTDGPTWLKALLLGAQLDGVTLSGVNFEELEEKFLREFLNESSISFISCNVSIFNELIILPNNSRTNKDDLQKFLCHLNHTQSYNLAEKLQESINWTSITSKMETRGPMMKEYEERAQRIRKDLYELNNLEDAFQKLSILANDFKLNNSKLTKPSNSSRPSKLQKNANEMWKALSPILCGVPSSSSDYKNDDGDMPELLKGGGEAKRAMRTMMYMMTNDPMILYAPNGTDADLVMRKSGHFLEVMQETKDLAGKWLSFSKTFQKLLQENKTQETLRHLHKSMDKFPFLYDPHMNRSHMFLYNTTGWDSSQATSWLRNMISGNLNKTNSFVDTSNIEKDMKNSMGELNSWSGDTLERTKLHELISMMMTKQNRSSQMTETLRIIDYVAKGWQSVLEPMKLDLFYGFKNETMLMRYIYNRTHDDKKQKPLLSAVLFDNINKDGSLPKHISYRIRMDSRGFFSTQSVRSRYWSPGPRTGNARYYYNGFVFIQDQLERAMIELLAKKNVTNPGLYIQQMPYPCFLSDNFLFVVQYIMPLCVVISFIYSVAILVQSIVYEKEQRLKEVMKMMGLSNAVHWTAWFITSIVSMITIVLLLTIVLKLGLILPASNTAIILIFLILAAIATIMFCFLLSIFFSKAKLAAACGGIIYFVTYMPYVFISIQEGGSNHMKIDASYKTVASLFSTTAFGLGARYFALFEQNGVGIQWSNIATSPIEDDKFNMAQVLTMLIVDTFLYAILVWYIEAIHPGAYGIPRPWYFPFQLSYWFGLQSTTSCRLDCIQAYRRVRQRSHSIKTNTNALLAVEEEPTHLKLGVTIDNLVKTYKRGRPPAVDHLSLNLYEGQITSFLGHNGAGKTTTMSLLTGLFSATSGTAYIYGDDIHKDMDKIRRSLGLCPQHNVLYSKMTVEEHLWFFARLKGMPAKQVEVETTRILEDVGLPEKRKNFVETLSGGMKRKLSVAMAFVGGSRTVILDEPTAGVDPYARRAIWELLAKYKDGRTILLSTHFMDEADILGDRIAIISHGKLRCVGSSLFLKTKFGDGYHLTLVREPETKASSDAISKFIRTYVPTALLICETQYEFSFVLPDKSKEKKNLLKNLFESLEKSKQSLGIKSFGLEDTTLEEVFLKVTEATLPEDQENDLTATIGDQETSRDNPADTQQTNDIPMTVRSPVTSETSTNSSDVFSENEALFNNITKSLVSPVNKRGHRRAFSTDTIFESPTKQQVPLCAHRRTPSGSYCGHRRALSTDLTFALNKVDLGSVEAVTKITSHRRLPSGTSLFQENVSNTSWDSHVGTSSRINVNLIRWQQFYGLMFKRLNHSKRNLKALMTHILLPGLFVSVAMTVALSQPKVDTYPRLVLSPTMFHPPPYYTPFNNNNKQDNMSLRMVKSLHGPAGIGSDCVLKSINSTLSSLNHTSSIAYSDYYRYLRDNLHTYFDDFCSKQVGTSYNVPEPIGFEKVNFNRSLSCTCDEKWQFQCDEGVGGNPETFNTVTQETMQYIKGRDFEEYLLYTNDMYRRRRYGALTFGDSQDLVPENVEKSKYLEVQRLFVKQTARVWTNLKAFHAMPAYLNAMNNAILRAAIPPELGNPSAYGITAVVHPLNLTENVLNLDSIKQGTDAIIAIFVIIAMSFVPASFVVFLVMERTTKAKHLQMISGMSPTLYWLSNYVWDFFNFMIPGLACMFIFHAFAVPAYASKTNFPAVCALFICYGWSITPMMYPASFLFREPSTAYVVLILLNLFLGITCTVTVSILQLFPDDEKLLLIFNMMRTGALIFPNYCLGRGLMDLAYNELLNQIYIQTGKFDSIRSPFEWDVVLRSLVFMISEGFIFFIITLMIEHRSSIKRKAKTLMDKLTTGEDIDVAAERERVLSGDADSDILRIKNLTKIYNSTKTGKHLAVNRLCVGVSKGECFGLLGVNGAGKTTTFKMLTGDIKATAGDAFVENISVAQNLLEVHQKIGYCPQFDALISHLTAEEHLYLYARLKGISELEIPKIVAWLIKKMALTRYAKQPSRTYSGGNKRKLSAAIALIGNPSVIFMDEPTTGMDPGARRFLWNVIMSIIKEGTKSVILTSHSMEECEALCTRVAIMVNGQFQCLGSTQHLKDRFGDGYIVVIRVAGSSPNMAPIKLFMEETFVKIVIKECHHNMVQYQIPSSCNKMLAEIFEIMEGACEHFNIEDYSVSQTSLDDVFVNFARNQRDMALESDPSFVCSKDSKVEGLRTRIRNVKDNISRRKPRVRFTSILPLLSMSNVTSTDVTGSIGEDEDEITLDEVDPLIISEDSVRLSLNV